MRSERFDMRKAAQAAGRLVPAVAVIALFVAALVAGGASANAPSATIAFAGNATLLSDPGSVEVDLKYYCLPPSPGFISVSLDEDGMQSSDFIPGATCDGKNHTATVTLAGLFTPGVAAGTAFVENLDGSASDTDMARVAIK
jgi:hypothetical protein